MPGEQAAPPRSFRKEVVAGARAAGEGTVSPPLRPLWRLILRLHGRGGPQPASPEAAGAVIGRGFATYALVFAGTGLLSLGGAAACLAMLGAEFRPAAISSGLAGLSLMANAVPLYSSARHYADSPAAAAPFVRRSMVNAVIAITMLVCGLALGVWISGEVHRGALVALVVATLGIGIGSYGIELSYLTWVIRNAEPRSSRDL